MTKINMQLPNLLEKVDHLKLVFLSRHLGLDYRVCVIDDRQEHVEKNEEGEEDKEYKVGGAKDVMCPLQLSELEISKKNAEL